MNATRTYEGWTIRFGFLDGNLGDHELQAHARDYAAAVQKALQAEYPGADIEVEHQRGVGSLPNSLQAKVFDTEGEGPEAEIDNIFSIAQNVYESFTWLPE